MKIYSWNINGIRAVLKKSDFKDFLFKEKPDVLLLQEVKITEEARTKKDIDFGALGYDAYWNSAIRPGYSGTLALVKKYGEVQPPKMTEVGPPSVKNGVGVEKFDKEGRVQTLEFADFFILNIYFPNANHELSRLNYKLEFNLAVEKYVLELNKKKPVILAGDFNVAHEEKDLARPDSNKGRAGFTKDERKWIHAFLKKDFVDVYREFCPDKIQYTWWTYRAMARERNVGWRIDYFIVAKKLLEKIKEIQIHDDIFGSDHCPLSVELGN